MTNTACSSYASIIFSVTMKNRAILLMMTIGALVIPVLPKTGLVDIGLKGGIGLSSFWGHDAADSAGMTTTMRSGVCAGAMLALNFNDFVSGQVEFLYSMKGKSAIGDYATYSKGITSMTDYFELPLLFRFQYPMGEISRLILFAGPTFSFLVSSKEDSTVQYQPSQVMKIDTTVDEKSQTNPYDVGITVGGGMAVKGGPGNVLFEVRYTLGLLTKVKASGANGRQLDIKNSYIAFLVGYSISLL
jgi:Outer membrane protein beta-barrel domain